MTRRGMALIGVGLGASVLIVDKLRVDWLNLEARLDALSSDLETTIRVQRDLERGMTEDVVAHEFSDRLDDVEALVVVLGDGVIVPGGFAMSALERTRARRFGALA